MSHRKPVRLLEIDLRTRTGHRISVCVSFRDGRTAPPVLVLVGGMWRVELPEAEARRLLAFLADWFGRD